MLAGYFDYLVLAVLIVFNAIFWRSKFNYNIGCLISGVVFGIILPIISMKIEIVKVKKEIEVIDGFNLLYTYLRFPMYWIVGIFQTLLINVRIRNQKGE